MVELLVAITIISLVMAAAGALFVTGRDFIQDEIVRVETTQGLRSTLETLARDLRLGGACMPTNGDFVSLGGTNSGTMDSIISRTGLVRPNLTCVNTALATDLMQGSSQMTVGSVSGFAVGMRAMLRNTNGTGETFTIAAVDTGQNKLLADIGVSQSYPKTSGVYAIDERSYSIDASNPQLPILTITANGGTPMPFASGVESLDIKYELARNCPPCDVVDAPPANSADWRLVNQIFIKATVRSHTTLRSGQYFRLTGQISAKPRNLLPE